MFFRLEMIIPLKSKYEDNDGKLLAVRKKGKKRERKGLV